MDSIKILISIFGTQAKAAAAVGVSQQSLNRWLNGSKKPSASRAIAIERATDGAVTRAEIRADIFGQV